MSGRGGRGGAGGYGTGWPMTFRCTIERRERDWRTGYCWRPHDVVRTGRTRPRPHNGRLGPRHVDVRYEYRCCGHVGWTTHAEILRRPVEAPRKAPPMNAYSVAIVQPTCECGKPATREVRTRRNEKVRDCCGQCAARLVVELRAADNTDGASYQGRYVSPDCL
jgi:hypothetical protein